MKLQYQINGNVQYGHTIKISVFSSAFPSSSVSFHQSLDLQEPAGRTMEQGHWTKAAKILYPEPTKSRAGKP